MCFFVFFSFYVSSSHPAYRITCFYVSRGHLAYRITCFYVFRSHPAYRMTCFYVSRSHPAYRMTCFYVCSGHPAYRITCFYVSRNHPVFTCPETIRHIDSFVGGVRTDPALTTIHFRGLGCRLGSGTFVFLRVFSFYVSRVFGRVWEF